MSPRDAFIKTFMDGLKAIHPSHKMTELYTQHFASLSDSAFEQMVTLIESEEMVLPLILPILGDTQISVERNLALGKKWGYEFHQHLILTDPTDPSVTIETPEKYLVADIFVRRQAQTLDGKRSIPKDTNQVDDLTGQVTGASKGSALTKPELHVMDFHNLENCIMELLKPRGGDLASWEAMDRAIMETGEVDLNDVDDGVSRAKSTETLNTWFKGAHIQPFDKDNP